MRRPHYHDLVAVVRDSAKRHGKRGDGRVSQADVRRLEWDPQAFGERRRRCGLRFGNALLVGEPVRSLGLAPAHQRVDVRLGCHLLGVAGHEVGEVLSHLGPAGLGSHEELEEGNRQVLERPDPPGDLRLGHAQKWYDLFSGRRTEMRKVIVQAWMTLDAVVQAPGDRDEDRSGGFEHGGWSLPYFEETSMKWVVQNLTETGGFLLGRRTYEVFASHWPKAPQG